MSAPTPYIATIAVDAVITALGSFLQPFMGSGTVIRGQNNRTPMPATLPFAVLTEVLQVDLETPTVSGQYSNAQITITSPKRIDIQIDIYGPTSGDLCTAVKGVYRTGYAVAQFPAGIAPLYCSDGHQIPLTDAEQQYDTRWTITASLQYNPAVYIPQQFATALAVNILEDIL